MSAPQLTEAESELPDALISRTLGEELRRRREARGWSRLQLVKKLPSGIGDRTLLSYEHGTRQLLAVRFVEVCHALGVDPTAVLGCALQRARTHIENLPLRVNLRALLNDDSTIYRPLAQWAKNTLNEQPDGIVELTPEVVKNLALFMGYTKEQLAKYLAQFLPDD
jgi:transcriptional regulator with XRE-family HTH domain